MLFEILRTRGNRGIVIARRSGRPGARANVGRLVRRHLVSDCGRSRALRQTSDWNRSTKEDTHGLDATAISPPRHGLERRRSGPVPPAAWPLEPSGAASPDSSNATGSQTSPAQPAAATATPTEAEAILARRRNWGRWGNDDQKGAANLITPARRASAAALVKSGRAVSLAHTFAPPQHYFRVNERGTGHSFVDSMGFEFHGVTVTHVDALCHMWDGNGMWNGRDPARSSTRLARASGISRPSATD